MKETKSYGKSLKTQEKLTKAFFSLYKNKKIETITVKEICDKAGYNRGTFYIHYQSVYDLLKRIETELYSEFQKSVKKLVQLFYNPKHTPEIIENTSLLFDKYDKYLAVLLSSNGDPLFQYHIKSMLKKTYIEHLNIDDKKTDPSYKYVLEYLAQANMSTISFWLSNRNQGASFRDILHLLHQINAEGANTILSKYLK